MRVAAEALGGFGGDARALVDGLPAQIQILHLAQEGLLDFRVVAHAAESYENGFNRATPVARKSRVFRVTSVRPLISAAATICLSRAFSG